MRFHWRTDTTEPLATHTGWLGRIERKNLQPGTSAPTLAAAWSGPLDLLGALAAQPALAGLAVGTATVEATSRFDDHGGNDRNHDLRLRATTAAGERVVVCVEAKAGETFGATVAEQRVQARKALATNPRSRALPRLEDLLGRLCPGVAADHLRYQLLTAWAGTLTDAAGADHAVFAVHEFLTEHRRHGSPETARELRAFGAAVLGAELPPEAPWCVRVPDAPGIAAALYVAYTRTDLRDDAVHAARVRA